MPEPSNRAVPFLAAFNDIEQFLRSALEAKKTDSFNWMVSKAENKHIITTAQANDLKEFAGLRNAISHGEYQDFRPIAEPLPETVAEIEKIRDQLLHPALAIEVLGPQNVITFTPSDDIHEPLRVIRDTGISQFPVYEKNQGHKNCVGVLTTNTIARWLAEDLAEDDSITAKTVGEVLVYNETKDHAIFLPRTATAAEVVQALTSPGNQRTLPRLVIITEHGNTNQMPLLVVTASNLPALIDAA
ncbi:CBS domain-containing protein [Corynebacterium aquatimens]|uniref:Transcriptional regulator n=1 Tax=Corynebacterium aquatimens TaxID=1190508 RepID=A0A931GTC6_9CORY|nr:CBS domain-containing protein [Corynebacterium aquatimens]MBG6121710.1 putative transcriptional regulator [Corynebacterium aquatimens]WJY65751.1 CBS domain protein [Corynebacterium aquatimens]